MAFDSSLYDNDAGYYLVPEGNFWLPGKLVPNGKATWSRRALDAAVNVDLNDSDILIATYPKTGQYTKYHCFHSSVCLLLRFIYAKIALDPTCFRINKISPTQESLFKFCSSCLLRDY